MRDNPLVICVDGPSGSGKGELARALAQRLGWHYLDSGTLYRVLAAVALDHGVDTGDVDGLVSLAEGLEAGAEGDERIRQEVVGTVASRIARHQAVRQAILEQQRRVRRWPGLVADGRDMGTVVFPEAELKIYLDADAKERARRRHKQLRDKGISVSLESVLGSIQKRDARDSRRAASPLQPAADAIKIDSTEMTIEEVLHKAMALVLNRGIDVGSGQGSV